MISMQKYKTLAKNIKCQSLTGCLPSYLMFCITGLIELFFYEITILVSLMQCWWQLGLQEPNRLI